MMRISFRLPDAIRRLALAAGLAMAAGTATAQLPSDFPTLKGNNARTGSASGTGPGQSFLTWFHPNTVGTIAASNARPYDVQPIELDNTDFENAAVAASYAPTPRVYLPIPNPLGIVRAVPPLSGPGASYLDEWAAAGDADSAQGPFLVTDSRPILENSVPLVSSNPGGGFARTPAYFYTRNTPSDISGDPTRAADPAQRRYFEFSVGIPNGRALQYALSMNVPVGRMTVPGGLRLLQQRYVVVEILWGTGPNQRFVDVVDTFQAGTGFVRLGNGGRPTDASFPFDGTNRIRVRVYNTIPRDSAGDLLSSPQSEGRLVFADGLRAVPVYGSIDASPTVTQNVGPGAGRVVWANNEVRTSIDATSGRIELERRGVVRSYDYIAESTLVEGGRRWLFRPSVDGTNGGQFTLDENDPSVTVPGGWNPVTGGDFVNGAAVRRSVTATLANVSRVTFPANVAEGDYEVWLHLRGGPTYARAARVEIESGGEIENVIVDMSGDRGWTRIGGRRYRHVPTVSPLRVRVTNFSADSFDNGRQIFADAVRFEGSNVEVRSTPVQATVNLRLDDGTIAPRDVVFVLDESGRIHCIDAAGDGAGNTDEYWVYPSRQRNGFTDPNLSEGIDGPPGSDEPVAQMPNGFDLSSALVQRIDGRDYLFVGARNGRVYCIDVAGRGDYNVATDTPGTARRVWSYPPDFPRAAAASPLGSIVGSVAFRPTSDGRGTIIVPASAGRVYALEALPTDAALVNDRTTRPRWIYPAEDEAALGAIVSTPAVDFGRIYFGTRQLEDTPGRVHAIDETTGAPVWVFPTDAQITTGAVARTTDFVTGVVAGSAAAIGGGMPDTIYALNENGYFFAINAATGAIAADATTTYSPTRELGTGSDGNLTLTDMSALDVTGGAVPTKAVIVPGRNGVVTALYARASNVNRDGGRRAWGYDVQGDSMRASVASTNGFMFAGDSSGYLYAFSNGFGIGSPGGGGIGIPGSEVIVENDSRGDVFRTARVRLLTRQAYTQLRQAAPGNLDRATALDPSNSFDRTPLAFEWGETAYILVHDFPYINRNASNQAINPPLVRISINVGGQTIRSIPVESRLFRGAVIGAPNSGYSVYSFTFQGGGENALPPGEAELQVSINTAALSNDQTIQDIALNPTQSRLAFQLANPLGIAVFDGAGTANPSYQIGVSPFPNNPQNLVNGSPNVTAAGVQAGDPVGDLVINGSDESRLLQPIGPVRHGESRRSRMVVYDRSMMSLIRPDGRGLDNVRVGRRELQWQGLGNTVFKPLNAANYPGFEDLPLRVQPNLSVDYPDVPREAMRVTKDPNGDAENPVFNGVSLKAPKIRDGAVLRDLVEGDRPEDRIFVPTPLQLELDVPRFQPPNNARAGFFGAPITRATPAVAPADPRFLQPDSGGRDRDQGYLGRFSLFVDSTGNGQLDSVAREANRTFNVSASVLVDQRLSIATPTVDPSGAGQGITLESLAGGAGWTLDQATDPFSPWTGSAYRTMFVPFIVRNEGNVNLLDVRLTKGSFLPQAPSGTKRLEGVGFYGLANDLQGWLNALVNLHSDIDTRFAPPNLTGGTNFVALQKARAGDTDPTELSPNPTRRENAVLGVAASALLNAAQFPVGAPRLAVTVPPGFPVGQYIQDVRAIENDVANDLLDSVNYNGTEQPETFSEPGVRVNFTVRESRLTGGPSGRVSPMIDDTLRRDAATVGANYSEQFRSPRNFRNRQPAAFRDAFGGLVTAWASDRDVPTPIAAPLGNPALDVTRIFLASLDNGLTFDANGISRPSPIALNPLRDLDYWNGAGTDRWWRVSGPIPAATATPADLFRDSAGGPLNGLVPATMRFGSPTFSTTGQRDPFAPATVYNAAYMAFTGAIDRISGDGRSTESRLYVTTVSPAADGTVTGGTDIAEMPYDTESTKGRPSLLHSGTSATIVYPATVGGATMLMATRFDPNFANLDPRFGNTRFTPARPLRFGSAFDAVTSASLVGRPYFGVDTAKYGSARIDVVFSARLRSSGTSELFLGTIPAVNGHFPENPDGSVVNAPFADLGERTAERLISIGTGTYRARGVDWRLDRPLELYVNGVNVLTGTPTRSPETGLVSWPTTVGGSALLDPLGGTVRITGGALGRNAVIRLRYTPRFQRLTPGGVASYGTATGLWDARNISEPTSWVGLPNAAGIGIRHDRLNVTSVRGAAGAGSTTRPYLATYRIGVALPIVFPRAPNGAIAPFTVTGQTGPYQVDLGANRIYLTGSDEDRPITVTTTAGTFTIRATMIEERGESPIFIEQAANETGLTSFLDPFAFSEPGTVRPPLMWMFWTSGRNGGSEIFFQSIAPRFAPLSSGGN